MKSVRDFPLGNKELNSLNEEAGLTVTVTGPPEFVMVTGRDYAARRPAQRHAL